MGLIEAGSKRLRVAVRLFGLVVAVGAAGYGCQGGCGLTATRPLPAPLPKDQTIEGGIQLRVSRDGLTKLASTIPDFFKNAFAQGLCVPKQHITDPVFHIGLVDLCDRNECPGPAQGCPAQMRIESVSFQAPDGGPLKLDTYFDIDSLPLRVTSGLISCVFHIKTDSPAHIVADIALGTDPVSGELSVHLPPGGIHTAELPLHFNSNDNLLCGFAADALTTLYQAINSQLGQALVGLFTPIIDQLLQTLLPKPLGIEGLVDTGSLLRMVAPQAPATHALLETRVVPGGYVDIRGGGLSLGVIAGMNSDADPKTRNPGANGPGTYHEHARCVPDIPLTLPELPRNPLRGSFSLLPVGAFSGAPEAPTDFAIGVSRRFLQVAGFHAINSGTLCDDVSSADLGVPLTVGAIGIILPSISALSTDGKEPLRVVLRPQLPFDFDVGTGAPAMGTMPADPALKVGVHDLKIDVYAFLSERYTRLFTLVVNLDAGVDLQFIQDGMGHPSVQPMLSGTQNIKITVENPALLAESADRLQMVFPMLTQLLMPVLAGQLKPTPLPSFGGLTLGDLRLGRVDSSQERFLAIFASLGKAQGQNLLLAPPRTSARVAELVVPSPDAIRDAVLLPPGAERDAALPHVVLELGAQGAESTEEAFEWQWSIDGGMWRPFTRDPHPTIAAPELVLQGRHTLDVRSRPVGHWERTDLEPVHLELLVDSGPPRLAPFVKDGLLHLGGSDLVSPDSALRYELAPAGSAAWRPAPSDRLDERQAREVAAANGLVDIAATDEAGNRAELRFDVAAAFGDGAGGDGGCAVGAGTPARGLGVLAAGALLLLAVVRMRKPKGLIVGFAVATLVLALGLAGCGGDDNRSCATDSDCKDVSCQAGAPICGDDNHCACITEIPLGHLGRFSSLALAGEQALVAAYNDTYGDLMLGRIHPPGIISNWEFVDGVPEGPVVLPQSMVRHGIRAGGDDVGRYTSLSTASDGKPRIAYHDATHQALRYALFDGAWKIHAIDDGSLAPGGASGNTVGLWASMQVRSDGAPGVAYYADRALPDGSHATELRFAQARGANPTAASDWAIALVASGTIAARPAGMVPPPMDLPSGVGLFPALARLADQRPVIAFYDRQQGNLMLATASAADGAHFSIKRLDGADAMNMDTGDVGMAPSLQVEAGDVIHLSYGSASDHALRYTNTRDQRIELIDDGYRIDGKNAQGLDQPVLHFVGDDSALVLGSGGMRMVAYQDATSHELLLATRQPNQTWMHQSLAGSNPEDGAFGFFTGGALGPGGVIFSSYVINQKTRPPSFFVQLFVAPSGTTP